MKTLQRIKIEPVSVQYIPEKEEMEYGKIYISNEFKTAVHLCLCGCGNLSVTPLNDKNDWWLLVDTELRITMTPSILNTNCPNRTHYVITKGIANII